MVLLASAFAACSGEIARDAGSDAVRDGDRDAGRDAGRRDAGPDAGHDAGPDDPGWIPLPGFPDYCQIERATRPEVLFQPRWEPCAEQPVGCRRQLPEWGPYQYLVYVDEAWSGGTDTYLWVGHPNLDSHSVSIIARLDGSAVAAWRGPSLAQSAARNVLCGMSIGLGEGWAAVDIMYEDYSVPDSSGHRIYHAPLSAIGAEEEPVAILVPPDMPGGQLMQRIGVSRELIAGEVNGSYMVLIRGSEVRTLLRVPPVVGSAQRPTVLGAYALWEDWSDLTRVAVASMTDGPSFLHRADPGDVKGFGNDGENFAWIQGYDRPPGGEYARIELWTAPAVTDASALAPRFVRLLEQRPPAISGGGWYVMLRSCGVPQRCLEVTSLDDGTQRQWIPPASDIIPEDPTYVTATEILVETISGDAAFNRYTALVRVDPRSLPLVP